MDDYNGTHVIDLSSYGNNGTAMGDLAQTDAGRFGKGLEFYGGSSDYIDVVGDEFSSDGMTFSAWFKSNVEADIKPLIGFDNASSTPMIAVWTNEQLIVYLSGGCYRYISGPISDGEWHYVAVTINQTNKSSCNSILSNSYSFVDGVYSVMTYNSGTPSYFEGNYNIGAQGSVGDTFNGTMDEVMLFSRVLNESEIDSLYNASATQYYHNFSGLVNDTIHNFTGYAVDVAGNVDSTQEYNVYVGVTGVDADGCDVTLDTPDMVYSVTDNLVAEGTCFTIGAHNVTIDLMGYSITGDGGYGDYGVYVYGYNDTVVMNGSIYNFYNGVYVDGGHNYNVTGVTIDGNLDTGIYVNSGSDYGNIDDCSINSNSGYGIVVYNSDYFNITDCTITDHGYSSLYFEGDNSTIDNNDVGYGSTSSMNYGVIEVDGDYNNVTYNEIDSYHVTSGSLDLYSISGDRNYVYGNDASGNSAYYDLYAYNFYGNYNDIDSNYVGYNGYNYNEGGSYNYMYGIYVYGNNNELSNNYNSGGLYDSYSDYLYGEYIYGDNNVITDDVASNLYTSSGYGYGMYLYGSNNVVNGSNSNYGEHSTSYDTYGIYVDGDYNTFEDVDFGSMNPSSGTGYGIYLNYADYSNISSGYGSYNDYGVYDYYGTYNDITDGEFSNNDYYGIYLYNSGYGDMYNNYVQYNDYGFYLDSSNYYNMTSNYADYNDYDGFYLSSSSNNYIIGNSMYSNSGYGVYASYSSYNNISENDIDYGDMGVYLDSSDYNYLLDNDIDYAGSYAIYTSYSDSNQISYNTLYSNSNSAIYLSSESDWNYVIGNDIDYSGYGITAYNSDYNNISYNDLYEANYGVSLSSGSASNYVMSNDVDYSDYSGVYLSSSSNNYVLDNTIEYGDSEGISLSSSDYNNISENTLYSNSYKGITLGGSSSNNITSNDIDYSDYGISLGSSSDYNTIDYNDIGYSDYMGIDFYYADYNDLDYNDLYGCSASGYGCIDLDYSDYNEIGYGVVDSGYGDLVQMYYSNYNTFYYGSYDDADGHGVHVTYSNDNSFNGMTLAANSYIDGDAFHVEDSSGNDYMSNPIDPGYSGYVYGTDYYFEDSLPGQYSFSSDRIEFLSTGYGSINFTNGIAASGSSLSDVISVTANNAFVNTSLDNDFNQSASIALKGVTISELQVIVDYDDDGTYDACPGSICTNQNYAGTTATFDVSRFTSYAVQDSNTAPNNPVVVFGSSGVENISSESLQCNTTISDLDGDALDVYVQWFLNDTLNLTTSYLSQANGSAFSAVLDYGNTSKNQNWTCGIRFFDGQWYSDWVNASEDVTIVNDVPDVTLVSPADWASSTNRTLEFNWSVVDADADTITYEFNLSEEYFVGDGKCEDDRYNGTLTETSYVPETDLECLHDNGYYYNWSVRAYDGEVYGNWTDVYHVNITAVVTISLDNASMNFGTLGPLAIENTSDDSPNPFTINNNGNAIVNISINSSSLWTAVSDASSFYQFKVDNRSGEAGAFSWIGSIVDWFNVPITGSVVAVKELNYGAGSDSAEIDIQLEVPTNEGPGAKNALVVFSSGLAE